LIKARPAFIDCVASPPMNLCSDHERAADFWEVTWTVTFGLGASRRVGREKHQALAG